MNDLKHPFIKIAGVCSILAPIVLIIGDLLPVIADLRFEWTIALWLAFVLFVPAIFGLTFLLFENGSRLALVGGILAFFGAMAGASMQVLFRVYAVLAERGADQTAELLRGTFKLIATTQMIGIFFPIGLILLAISIYRSRIFNSATPFLLAGGAILFPVGRIAGLVPAVFGSGVLLLAAFGLIGWHILSKDRTQLSETEPATAN
jgi:hypothetical protein